MNQPIIDIDLHHRWHSEADLIEYLPSQFRAVLDRSRTAIHVEPPPAQYYHTTGNNKRADAYPPSGGPPGSHYETLCEQWLDPYPVERAVLSFDIGTSAGVVNPTLASALCGAANDWCIDRWIDGHRDERLYTAVLAPTQIPLDGAAEIRRLASNPRVVEALVVSNGLGKPFGHPAYDPLYDAAQECDLPIAIHNGGDFWNATTHMSAAGLPSTRFEYHTIVPQSTITHLVSFITNGVFEKFPRLRLCIIEIGVSWIPWVLWSLDRQFPAMRRENPWLKRLPSEIVREHVKVSSQPLEISPRNRQLIDALEAAGGVEDILVFASDYPHWDTDDADYMARRLPKAWLPKVFYENALDFFRWPADAKTLDSLPVSAGASAA